MKPVLLHICCGICSSWAIEKLKLDGFLATGFFYNPNIQPEEEYLKRLAAVRDVANLQGIELLSGEYDPQCWLKEVQGLEQEPEGGKRCSVCFELRLQETLRKARELGIKHFTTTLSISPHKNFETINFIGRALCPDGFLPYNFKKEAGFQKSNNFCREHNLYRQNYCGCLFSRIPT